MRATWIVLGLVVAVGTVAYWKLRAEAEGADATALLQKTVGEAPGQDGDPAADPPARAPTEDPAAARLEARAREILAEVGAASRAKDRSRYDAAVARLRKEAWNAPSARAFAVKLGLGLYADASSRSGLDRIRRLDAARRTLSRGIWNDDLFDAKGRPTKARTSLLQAIQEANRQVMTFARREGGGLAGVTRPFRVPAGWAPIVIVSRKKLPYGPNALLYWNKSNLDPRRIQAGEILLLPVEALSIEIDRRRHRLALFLGDWFVKEFEVGVGLPEKPTPAGVFTLGKKRQENPPWWSPQGKIPFGDPRNELGAAWIGIRSESVPESAGYGLHGTNKPETVGTDCSQGCVRLHNSDVTELYRWMRSDSAGGAATVIRIF
ncbi:MAG: L,D-transpeptidase [Planctomycetota bacterium]